MKIQHLNTIKKAMVKYYNSLNINTVSLEFIQEPLLNQNSKLLKVDKTKKKDKSIVGEISHIHGLELVPAKLLGQGVDFCAGSGSCLLNCLFFSGIQNILKSNTLIKGELTPVIKKRIRRTFLFLRDQSLFYKILTQNINAKNDLAVLMGQKNSFAIRLNVMSDVDFTPYIDSMPHVQFMDYSKVWNRSKPKNYDVTYSSSELVTDRQIINKLKQGNNVAMVFKKGTAPKTWKGFPCISGDLSDDRVNDIKGCILVLDLKTTVKAEKIETAFINRGIK